MQCCCSRYTSGVLIGSFYIVIGIIFLISESNAYVEYNKIEDPKLKQHLKSGALKSIIICIVTAVVSALYIVANIKRKPFLMFPWFLLGIYLFYITCVQMFLFYITAGMGYPSLPYLLVFAVAVLAFVIQIAVFFFSCSVFKQLCVENTIIERIPT